MMAGTKVAAALAAAIAICVPEPEQDTVVPNIQYAFIYNLASPPVKVDSGEVEQEFLVEAVPVVWAESRGNPEAVNPASGTCGLFQIHPVHWRKVREVRRLELVQGPGGKPAGGSRDLA